MLNKLLKNENIKKLFERENNSNYYSFEFFCEHIKQFFVAIKKRNIIISNVKPSTSGMSRQFTIHIIEKNSILQLSQMLKIISPAGITYSRKNNNFRVSGCGMDMFFNTLYCFCSFLKNNKIITKQTFEKLNGNCSSYKLL